MDKLRIYLDPKPAPRMPPVTDVNHTDLMLGAAILAMVGACMLGGIVWAVWH
jgi:hypothetical protein